MFLPFSEKARQLAQSAEFTLTSEDIEIAVDFIEAIYTRSTRELSFSSDDLFEVKRFATCKAILALCPYHVVARFGDNYSRLLAKLFREHFETAREFATELFPSLTVGDKVTINVFEFLAAEESISFYSVSNGIVSLSSSEELLDVLASQVKRKVLSAPDASSAPQQIQAASQRLAEKFALPLRVSSVKWLEKEDIKKIRQGVAEGGRYYACMKLSRACFKDGLSLKEAMQVIMDFTKACPASRNPFTEREALTCLNWVYSKGQKGAWK